MEKVLSDESKQIGAWNSQISRAFFSGIYTYYKIKIRFSAFNL